jgi:hypothetical protein
MVGNVTKIDRLLVDNLAGERGNGDDNDSLAGLIITFFSGICLEQNLGPDRNVIRGFSMDSFDKHHETIRDKMMSNRINDLEVLFTGEPKWRRREVSSAGQIPRGPAHAHFLGAEALWHFCGKYRRLGPFCRFIRLVSYLPSIKRS